jgi:hypothetical protein
MQPLVSDTIGGFNSFIAEQKRVPGEARVTLVQFDDHYESVYSAYDIQRAHELTLANYVPRGSTALLDAVGRTLEEQGKRIAFERWADKVVVCIITDGMENASRLYRRADIQQMIRRCEEHGWSFVYLGANQDAFAEANRLGIDTRLVSNAVSNYAATSKGVAESYAFVGATVTRARKGENVNTFTSIPGSDQ